MYLKNILCFCKTVFFFIYFISAQAQVFDLNNYLEKTKNDSDSVFYENFPYHDFCKIIEIDNISSVKNYREILKNNGRSNADAVIINTITTYHETYPLDCKDIIRLTVTAETGSIYSNIQEILCDSAYFYVSIGDYILNQCAQELELALKEKRISKTDSQIATVQSILQKNQYYIDIPKSRFEKLKEHIKEGNWSYILDRAKNLIISYPIVFGVTGILILLIFCILIRRWFLWKSKRKKKNN